jgi:hypothetical protein
MVQKLTSVPDVVNITNNTIYIIRHVLIGADKLLFGGEPPLAISLPTPECIRG